jgi:hypothetical protein
MRFYTLKNYNQMTIKQQINKLKSKHGLTSKKVAELIGISIGNFRNKQSDKNLKENFNDNHLTKLNYELTTFNKRNKQS